MGRTNCERGLQDPSRVSSSTGRSATLFADLPSQFRKVQGTSRVSKGHVVKRSYRDSSLDSWLLQPSLCGSKSHRGLETGDRSKCTKCVREMPILQDGDAKIHPGLSVQESMDGIHRPQGRLFSCPNPPPIKTIPPVLPSGQGLAVQVSSLRVVDQPKGVYEDPTTCLGSCSPQWRELTHVPRRLADQSKIEPVRCASDTVAPVPLSSVGPDSKFREVGLGPFTENYLSRDVSGYSGKPGKAFRQTSTQMALHSEVLSGPAGSSCRAMATNSGSPGLLGEAGATRPIKDMSTSVATQTALESINRLSRSPSSSKSGVQILHALVDDSGQPVQGGASGHSCDRRISVHGQLYSGLGCSYGKPTGIRPVVPSTKIFPHQPSGTTCCVVGASSLFQLPGTNQCCHHVGQHVHSCLLEKSGGHSVTTDVRPGITGVPMGRSSSDHFDPQTYSGTLECQSRLSEPQGSDNQNRMESKSGRGRQDFPPLGQSTCGLICSNGEHKTGYLHVPNSGDSSLESGQPSAVLGRSLCLCIPTNSPNPIMPKQDQIGQSRGHPDCAILAEPGVVSRPRGLVNRFSNNPSPNEDSPQTVILPPVSSMTSIAEPSRMAIISGYIEQRGFSKQVSQRLSVPQRKSTSEVYDGKWKVFRQWCQSQQLNPATTSIPDIADFLLFLFSEKKLSISTIKGYRSCLSQVMSARGIDISSNSDLNLLVRSFTVERPLAHREIPRWDLLVVLRYLMKAPFEKMETSSLKHLTMKTAFLLSLATAKRNSELHAFSAIVAFPDGHASATLSFLPDFIAKTTQLDKPDGGTLTPVTIPALAPTLPSDHSDRSLCPVRALRLYLERTKAGKDSLRPRRLFVSYKPDHNRDIHKATLSGWIKLTIREAYRAVQDEDLPHFSSTGFQARELRAHATTLAFSQHHSLSQVMSAASWRNSGTFAQFYLRDIPSCEGLSSLGPFVAGQFVIGSSE